jgi:hypothetical protein
LFCRKKTAGHVYEKNRKTPEEGTMKNVLSRTVTIGVVILFAVAGTAFTGTLLTSPDAVRYIMEHYASGIIGIFCLAIGQICR